MNKNIFWIVAVVIVGAGAFFAGSAYGKGQAPTRGTGQLGGQFAGRSGGGTFVRGSGTAGQIIAKDATSITVKMPDGSTKIVLLGDSTPVMKTVSGSGSDLQVGQSVVVMGNANSDGSVTAQSVQIRPASTTRAQ